MDPREHYADPGPLARRASFNARHGTKSWFGWLSDRIPLASADRVLDLGCGPGGFWRVRPPPPGLVLVDQVPAMVARATAATGAIEIAADAHRLPFPDGTFDAVLAIHMLYHTEPEVALAEIARVLAPNGRLYATAPDDGDLASLAALSRTVLGSSADDLVVERFGGAVARHHLVAQFGPVEAYAFTDTYHIGEADDVVDYLASMPPGDAADAATLDALGTAAGRAIRDAGGTLVAERRQVLFVARPRASRG